MSLRKASYIPGVSFVFDSHVGKDIPIEQRHPDEVTCGFGQQTAPDGIEVYNPAFDVTPTELVTAVITERGVIYPPFSESPLLQK